MIEIPSAVLNAARAFTDSSNIRKVAHGVHFNVEHQAIQACNGHRYINIPFDLSGLESSQTWTLPTGSLGTACELDGNTLSIYSGIHTTLKAKHILLDPLECSAERWPDFGNFPTEDEEQRLLTHGFHAEYLSLAEKAFGKKCCVLIRSAADGAAVVIRPTGDDESALRNAHILIMGRSL